VSGTNHSRRRSTRSIVIVGSVIAIAIVATIVSALFTRRGSVRQVLVPSVISLPAPQVQDSLKQVDLVAQPQLLGWRSSALPWGSIASQDPGAGTQVAVGTHVRVGFYLAGPGGLEPPRWPTSVLGSLTKQGAYSNPAKIGTLITKADLQFGPLMSKSFVGPDGYALATFDGFVYPAASRDGGATWRVAGLWFAGPWADAAAFPDTIRTYSQDVAVAFYPGEQVFYATTDGGMKWIGSSFPGSTVRVWGYTKADSSASSISVQITNYDGAKKTATYDTTDSGRSWSLTGQAGVSGIAAVPNLAGMTIAQASRTLVENGFVPVVDHLWATDDSPQVVVSQMPSAGAIAQRGVDVAIAVPH
jgi:hypothetical protein